MKIKWFILSCLFGYQHSCFTHNLDKYTVLYPDLIEIVEKQCKNADQDQKLIIQEHVQALIDDIVINQRQTGRSYTFFSIENEFNRQEGDKESYVFYVILYVEFEPNIFDNISLCKKDKIQKMVVKHLLKLYDSKSIAFKKVLPGCCVSCIKIGIDAVSKHHKQ